MQRWSRTKGQDAAYRLCVCVCMCMRFLVNKRVSPLVGQTHTNSAALEMHAWVFFSFVVVIGCCWWWLVISLAATAVPRSTGNMLAEWSVEIMATYVQIWCFVCVTRDRCADVCVRAWAMVWVSWRACDRCYWITTGRNGSEFGRAHKGASGDAIELWTACEPVSNECHLMLK